VNDRASADGDEIAQHITDFSIAGIRAIARSRRQRSLTSRNRLSQIPNRMPNRPQVIGRVRDAMLSPTASSLHAARLVNGQEFEAGAGDILVIKAGEIHSFKNTGETPLVQLDVHLSARFIQENL
jgi:hypothetical protein